MSVAPNSRAISDARYSSSSYAIWFTPTGLSPSMVRRSSRLQISHDSNDGTLTPHVHYISVMDSVCPSAVFDRLYLRHTLLVSFPLPTKMLQFGGFPFSIENEHKVQEVLFGHHRFLDSLRLPGAFRSLARPSSVLEPSHPPDSMSSHITYGTTLTVVP